MFRNEYETKLNEKMRGGDGVVKIENFLTQEELYDKGRLFGKITLEKGCSIGSHVHENEMEAFHILKGTAEFDDNGEKRILKAGDTTLTKHGEGHSIKNIGDETVELIALIIFK